MSRGTVRAVFFDVGGTVLHPWPSVGAIYAGVANRHGIPATAEELDKAFRESWIALKQPGLTVSSKEWWRKVVFRTLRQENEACFEELYETFSRAEFWRIFPDVEDTLHEARLRRLHIGVISNWDERLRLLLHRLSLTQWFDSLTISCEVGAEKPDPCMFKTALRAAGVAASEAVHVGDSQNEDVRGAEAVGMRAILLNRKEKTDGEIRDLRDLWRKLDDA